MAVAGFKQHAGHQPGPSVTTTQPMSAGPPPPQYFPWSGYPPTAPQPQQPIMAAPQQQQMNTINNNIIITTQPGAGGRPVKRDWSSGLCACFSDMGSCLLGWCCPLLLQCIIAKDMGDPCCNAFCLMCCAPGALFALRAHMRGKENIQGTLFDDFNKTAGCCSCLYPCVLCQLAREVKFVKANRGYV